MKFHWWWILIGLLVLWAIGWLVGVIFGVFFNPADTAEDKRKDFRGRLLSQALLNWILWPMLLPAILNQRKFNRDVRTGKIPAWMVLADGEERGKEWKLSDGTLFGAYVSDGSSSERSHISADYEGDAVPGPVEYRIRTLAPTPQPATDWKQFKLAPRGLKPDPDDEDAADGSQGSCFEVSVQLPRGKHLVEFRVPNRSGKIEECSGVTLIVTDPGDYD